jgi:S-adenosylmethionine/arginine decarboxylase-like enzyme
VKCFGHELLLDLYQCEPNTVDSINISYQFLINAVKTLGVTMQSPPFVFRSPGAFPDKAGLSGWVPLIESGIQIHTLSVRNFVSVDYYTCCDQTEDIRQKLIDLAIMTFGAKYHEFQFIERGNKYFDL